MTRPPLPPPRPVDDARWYVMLGPTVLGPLSTVALRRTIEANPMDPATRAKRNDELSRPLYDFPEFSDLPRRYTAPPATPPAAFFSMPGPPTQQGESWFSWTKNFFGCCLAICLLGIGLLLVGIIIAAARR